MTVVLRTGRPGRDIRTGEEEDEMGVEGIAGVADTEGIEEAV